MNILAIEASAKVAGAAVMENGQIIAEQNICSGLTHSQTLMPMVEQVMQACGMQKDAVDVIAFTNGPGSFTGLRIGAATAKGLALGWQRPVLPLSTLEVLAFNAVPFPGLIVPVMDARRHQVYAGVYRAVDGQLETVREPMAIAAAELSAWLAEQGETAMILGDVYTMSESACCVPAPAHLQQIRAGSACALAQQKLAAGVGPIPSDQVVVEYLRRPQAERERMEKEAGYAG